jgi:hypothetical protein
MINRVINIIQFIVYQRRITLTTNTRRSRNAMGAETSATTDGREHSQQFRTLRRVPPAGVSQREAPREDLPGDCLEILAAIPSGCVDLIFADPPYSLSTGGITCHAGRMVSVSKGKWDQSQGPDLDLEFDRTWLAACQSVLKPHGSIRVSGTGHAIHSVGFAMQELGKKLLNDITWAKPNPPPNLSCRYFTHATETIIWAAKNKKSKHTFNRIGWPRSPNSCNVNAGSTSSASCAAKSFIPSMPLHSTKPGKPSTAAPNLLSLSSPPSKLKQRFILRSKA